MADEHGGHDATDADDDAPRRPVTRPPAIPGPAPRPSGPADAPEPTDTPEPARAPEPTDTAHPAHRRPRWGVLAGVVGAALVLGTAGGWIAGAVTARPGASGSCNAVTVARDTLPSIVTVNASGSGGSGVGSGAILRRDGYIITNNHVISPAASGGTLSVTFSGGTQAAAKLVGRDPASDLAVLKVTTDRSLPAISVADSDSAQIGQPVVALGAPLGLSGSVTTGIVSALDRDVPVPTDGDRTTILVGALQTDAAVNPGNSGGALVDCSGALVGVNTAIATVPSSGGAGGGGSVGIGFAIPSNFAVRVADDIIAHGRAVYPYAGLQVAPISQEAADHFGVAPGLSIRAITPDGPAAKAGLKVGDTITHLNGDATTRLAVLNRLLLSARPGDTVKVTYVRDGHERTTTLTLGTQ